MFIKGVLFFDLVALHNVVVGTQAVNELYGIARRTGIMLTLDLGLRTQKLAVLMDTLPLENGL